MKVGDESTHPKIPEDIGPDALRAKTIAETVVDGGVEGVVAEERADDVEDDVFA